ncbi:hypothetical protein AJ80_01658 [Polytolypa hystricis UAMH7299]|uniref:CHCH domain-containing protein n=1 Tax=Polytolypa hystricis (strain UAMH7299) TaxID=1447883 RepID=A0A2B7Z0V2_POLH7|nr:hypothetical protein AJ80_01658 [Polytolypa hystricis UAMH7299]
MARQRRGAAPARSAPSRPTAAPPARPAGTPMTQQRPASTSAAPPPAAAQQAPAQSQGSGLFGQMASTAAGVAVGSAVGHTLGGWFSGGSSSSETAAAPPADTMDSGLYQSNGYSSTAAESNPACETDVRAFRKCMDDNQGNMSICGWYLDQLKACQQAAKPY